MPKKRQNDDDRDWDPEQPQKNSTTHVLTLSGKFDLVRFLTSWAASIAGIYRCCVPYGPDVLLHRRPVGSVAADLDGVICHGDAGLPAVGRTALHGLSGLELDRKLNEAILARDGNIASLPRPDWLVPGQVTFITVGHPRMRRDNGAVAVIEYGIRACTFSR